MKRKLVKQGGSALTVTLPFKWVKQQHLEAGDDIILEERENELLIRGRGEPAPQCVSLDVHALNERTIRWMLSGFHKGGYDEIEIYFTDKSVLTIIQELVKDMLLGFAIIEQTDKRCVLRMLARDSSEEIDATLRRAFLVTLSLADTILDLVRQKKCDAVKSLIALERTNNQLTNFCERILNKNLYEENKGTHFLYTVIWNLEKIGDDYKRLCDHIATLTALDEETLALFEQINKHFKMYYELFYKFNPTALAELSVKRDELLQRIAQNLRTKKGDMAVLSCFSSILLHCEDFSTSMFMLAHYGKSQA